MLIPAIKGQVELGEQALRIRDSAAAAEVELTDEAVAGVLESALLEQRPLGTLDVDLQQVDLAGPGAGEQIGDGDQIDFNGAPPGRGSSEEPQPSFSWKNFARPRSGPTAAWTNRVNSSPAVLASRRSKLIGSDSAATISADGNRARRNRTEIPVFAPRSTIVLAPAPPGLGSPGRGRSPRHEDVDVGPGGEVGAAAVSRGSEGDRSRPRPQRPRAQSRTVAAASRVPSRRLGWS